MKLTSTRLLRRISVTIAIFTVAVPCAFGQNVSPRGVSSAALTVQVGLLGPDGGMSPVSSATIYVMYGSVATDRAGDQESSTDTAGAQFRIQFKKLLREDRGLKNLGKKNRKGDNAGLNNTMSTLALHDLDEALAAMRDWIAHHPDSAWQLRTVTADRNGEWTVTGLDPGPYEIIARGRFAQYEVDWEANASLRSDMTLTLPMTTPRFIARADK